MLQNIKVKNEISLITGSCGHLGKEFANSLAEIGYNLILTDKSKKDLVNLKKEIEKKFKNKVYIKACNLSSYKSREKLIRFIKIKTNKLNLIVNNAALTGIKEKSKFDKKRPLKIQTIENFEKHLQVNLTAAFHLTKNLSDQLIKSKKGKVINIGSIYSLIAPKWEIYNNQKMNNRAGYSASKGGLLQLTRWFASYLGPKVRVNMISPGGILRGHNNKFKKKYNSNTSLERMANLNEINGTLIYLATDLSSYVTGQNIIVDGGWTTL